jgi:hypothetical protein
MTVGGSRGGVWRAQCRQRGAPVLLAGLALFCATGAQADEGGASVYIPGQFASFAAEPDDPGFSFETSYYHRYASASRTFPIDGGIDTGIAVTEDYVFLMPTYAFTDRILGGRLSIGVSFALGGASNSASAALIGPGGAATLASQSDAMTNFGDIAPFAALKWNAGPHNFMTYISTNVPVGAYDPNRIVSLGSGHWAIDGGVGYTFISETGLEASVTVGATKNFINPQTQYLSGTEGHLDWGVSYSLSENFYLGVAGYVFCQLEPDSGAGAVLGGFEARVNGIGPQMGYSFSTQEVAFEIELRGYKEFDAVNRPEGWNIGFVVSMSRSRHGHATR